MFSSVLVANRGEIAVRVIRTLHRLGVRAVAVHSEADRGSVHVACADESVLLGPADIRSSYLSIERVVAAAQATGAQAIHPGYGFLSENPDLAEACEAAGIVFVGPTAATIRAMGDKRGAKDAVASLGIPVVPGFHGPDATDAELVERMGHIGFPVIVKPSAGGGGKGMRVVPDPAEALEALAASRREAVSAFGDGSLLLERFLPRARHVEVQVLGDGLGTVLHLGDRDCSLQRRHQKVIEEAPAPFLDDDVRSSMRAAAVRIAESVAYRGVGTVEYVVDADDPSTWFFLEMNTRLQVEHPVTELVTGLDLVELQLRVAAGEGLTILQDDVRLRGHAVEARVYAEDGHHRFLPSSGTVVAYHEPSGVRVDSGVARGTVVGTAYDPLLLKVIARADDRASALAALDAALCGTTLLGVAHNVGALRRLVRDPKVADGSMTTGLIAELGLGDDDPGPDPHVVVAAALGRALLLEPATPSPWTSASGWRVGGPAWVRSHLLDDTGSVREVVRRGPLHDGEASVDGGPILRVSVVRAPGADLRLDVTVDGVRRRYDVASDGASVWVGRDGDAWELRAVRRTTGRRGTADVAGGELRSPMPGSVVVVARAPGERVGEGELIAVVEAMKMEYPVVSPVDGVVVTVGVVVGAQVVRDQVVAVVVADAAP